MSIRELLASILVCALAAPPASAVPSRSVEVRSIGGRPQARADRTSAADERPNPDARPSPVLARLEELEGSLDRIQTDKGFRPLFDSEDAVIILVQAHFFRAKSTAHELVHRVRDGGAVDASAADAFHSALREYLINLEEMPPNHTFGATKSPDAATKKRLVRAVRAAIGYANATEGMADVEFAGLRSDGDLFDTIAYARRSLSQAYVLLDHRTLSNVTSNGVAAARDLRGALDAAWRALDKIVDDDGQLAEQLDAEGRVLADPLAPFKAAMKEAAIQAEFYRRNYRPVAWPDAHRRRAERIERVLAPTGFINAFVGASAFRAATTSAAGRR